MGDICVVLSFLNLLKLTNSMLVAAAAAFAADTPAAAIAACLRGKLASGGIRHLMNKPANERTYHVQ